MTITIALIIFIIATLTLSVRAFMENGESEFSEQVIDVYSEAYDNLYSEVTSLKAEVAKQKDIVINLTPAELARVKKRISSKRDNGKKVR